MIYLRADNKWYKTKFKDHNKITLFAWDYIDMIYDKEKEMFVRAMKLGIPGIPEMNAEALKLEIWMQDTSIMPYFNEKKFIKIKQHFKNTGQKVKTDYSL